MSHLIFKVGQEVTYKNAFGVNVIREIKGAFATVYEYNTETTYRKKLSSLKHYVRTEFKAYWSEQELATPVYNHGATVFTTLSISGNGSRMVWDDIQKKCVVLSDLTKK
jgi:hypothetical protein